jgi:aspartyl-tRNA(Asn)/glutamyl-tRNA(Gln) amidotransferase subunit B
MEAGETLAQETRGFEAVKGITLTQRSKEHAHDYRYFPEPDLPPVVISEQYISGVKAAMPKLPADLVREYIETYGLPAYDARIITDDKELAAWFNDLLSKTKNYKAAANLLLGPIKNYLNENGLEITEFKVSSERIAQLIALIDEGKTNFSIASTRILPVMTQNPDKEPLKIAEELNLLQSSDEDSLKAFVEAAVSKYPDKVVEYKNGKKGLLALFVGEVMKLSKGKADPKVTSRLVLEKLES